MNYTKWAIRRHPGNYKEINKYFSYLNNREYTSNGTYYNPSKLSEVREYDFLVYPKLWGTSTRRDTIPEGYMEISWEEFQIYILYKKLHYELY